MDEAIYQTLWTNLKADLMQAALAPNEQFDYRTVLQILFNMLSMEQGSNIHRGE